MALAERRYNGFMELVSRCHHGKFYGAQRASLQWFYGTHKKRRYDEFYDTHKEITRYGKVNGACK